MLQKILLFARQHDWGEEAYIHDGKVWVKERYSSGRYEIVGFDSMSKIRNWAGY